MPIRNCDRCGIAWHSNRKMEYPRFSLPPGLTCPGKTQECYRWCYDRRLTQVYPSLRPSWARNFRWTTSPAFIPTMTARIQRRAPAIFRIHEAGDFYSRRYFRAWCQIAARCPQTQFFSFSKSFALFKLDRPKNLVLIASMFYDETRRRPAHAPAFYTVRPGETGPGQHCHGRCDACGICPYATAKTTVWTERH